MCLFLQLSYLIVSGATLLQRVYVVSKLSGGRNKTIFVAEVPYL